MDKLDHELDELADKLNTKRDAVPVNRISKKNSWSIVGLAVALLVVFLSPFISEHFIRHEWKSEHSPSMAIIFEPQSYFAGNEAIKKIDKPFYQCNCVSCRWGSVIDGKFVHQDVFVITEAAENLLQKTGLRYQREYIGYKKGCSFHDEDVARNNFVNW